MPQTPSPLLSGSRGFYKEGEGNRMKRSRKEVIVLHVLVSTVHSNKASDGLAGIILASPHPGSTAEGQQTSRGWDS